MTLFPIDTAPRKSRTILKGGGQIKLFALPLDYYI